MSVHELLVLAGIIAGCVLLAGAFMCVWAYTIGRALGQALGGRK